MKKISMISLRNIFHCGFSKNVIYAFFRNNEGNYENWTCSKLEKR